MRKYQSMGTDILVAGGAIMARPANSVINIPTLKDTDAAWLAGFLDGEGHFAVQRTAVKHNGKQYYVPILQVTQAGEAGMALILQIREMLGGIGTLQIQDRSILPGNQKDAAVLMLYGEMVEDICGQLLPYLRLKRRQAEVLAGWPHRRVLSLGRGGGTAPDLETEAQQIALFNELRTLNARGRTKSAEA